MIEAPPYETSLNLPTVCFIIPTYNAERYLDSCLRSIFDQDYPKNKIEAYVVDGGSKDDTLKIAKRYPSKILVNPKRLAEVGLALGARASRADLVVAFAADNVLPTRSWLMKMVAPFGDHPDLSGIFPFPVASPNDSRMNRYYCRLRTDPLTFFVFDSFGNKLRAYKPVFHENGYKIFQFSSNDFPLIALAQGFIYRRELTPDSIELDDVAPFCDFARRGYKLAMMTDVGIYHYHLDDLKSFVRKYVYRAMTRVRRSPTERPGLMNSKRRLRMRLWLLYSLTWIWPLYDVGKGYKEEPDDAWLYHPLACCLLTVANVAVGLTNLKRSLQYMSS